MLHNYNVQLCLQAALQAATEPGKQRELVRVESHGFTSVAALLPRLQLCKRLLMEVRRTSWLTCFLQLCLRIVAASQFVAAATSPNHHCA